MTVRIAPSILSCDFGRLAEEIAAAEEAGADWIHVDVMDGAFVPNLTIGPVVVEAARRATDLPLDVHLMIEAPEHYLEAFAGAGADLLTVHEEACRHLHRTVETIRSLDVRPGVAVNPATPVSTLHEIVPYIDLILVMSVNPGFGGQSFIPTTLSKLREASELIRERGEEPVELEVDGGIDATTAGAAVEAGATVLVAGSAVFRDPEGAGPAIGRIRASLSPIAGLAGPDLV